MRSPALNGTLPRSNRGARHFSTNSWSETSLLNPAAASESRKAATYTCVAAATPSEGGVTVTTPPTLTAAFCRANLPNAQASPSSSRCFTTHSVCAPLAPLTSTTSPSKTPHASIWPSGSSMPLASKSAASSTAASTSNLIEAGSSSSTVFFAPPLLASQRVGGRAAAAAATTSQSPRMVLDLPVFVGSTCFCTASALCRVGSAWRYRLAATSCQQIREQSDSYQPSQAAKLGLASLWACSET